MIQGYSREIKIVGLIFLFKLAIIFLLPLTGDEAYFIVWGHNPASGFYDHPPMVGWVIYLMSFVSENFIFFRMFSVLTTLIVAYSIYKISALYVDKNKAFLVGLLFLASPADILLGLLTNDIPLVLFGTLGTQFLLYSFEKEKPTTYALLAGLFLGAAFLSKYFAGFLLVSLLVFVLIEYKTKAIKNVLIVTFIVSLAIAQNLYFNYNSCWNNIMFNFFARSNDVYDLAKLKGLFLILIYLFTPWGLYFLYKSRKNEIKSSLLKLTALILGLMFIIFFMVSLKNSVGIHWFILFLPYMFILFSTLNEERLRQLFKYNTIFTFVHIAILLGALITLKVIPKEYIQEHKNYVSIIQATKQQEICDTLKRSHDDREIFALGYTTAAMISYGCHENFHILFNNSKYGRLDDKLLDVRRLDTKDIYLFDNDMSKPQEFLNVCNSASVEELDIEGAKFYVMSCNGFRYKDYKKYYLDVQRKKFYDIPEWLPKGECYFNDRYYR